jgi:hypothetical protein
MAATYDQLAQTYGGTDLVVHNYGGSDIPANVPLVLDTTNYVGDTNQAHTVPGVAAVTTQANPPTCILFSLEIIKAGANGRARGVGPTVVATLYLASGSVAPGDVLDATPTAGHVGTVTSHTAAKASVGFALSGGVSGDPVLLMLAPSFNA